MSDVHCFSCMLPFHRGSVFLRQRCVVLCTSGFMDGLIFAHRGPYGGMSIPLPRVTWRHRVVVRRITPLLRLIGCVVSQTAGAETRRCHRARGAGVAACNSPLLCSFGDRELWWALIYDCDFRIWPRWASKPSIWVTGHLVQTLLSGRTRTPDRIALSGPVKRSVKTSLSAAAATEATVTASKAIRRDSLRSIDDALTQWKPFSCLARAPSMRSRRSLIDLLLLSAWRRSTQWYLTKEK